MRKITRAMMRRFLDDKAEKARVRGSEDNGILATVYSRFSKHIPHLAKFNVIILHGYRGTVRAKHFKDLANELDDEFGNTATCDLVNFGKSFPVDERLRGQIPSFPALVEVAQELTYIMLTSKTRGHVPTFVIGYSVGAIAWLRFLETFPSIQDYLAGAVFISLPLRVEQNADPSLLRWRSIIEPLFGVIATLRPHMPIAKYEPDEFSRDDPYHYKGDMEARTGKQILKASKASWRGLKKIRIPVLFVHGAKDVTAPFLAVEDAFAMISTPLEDKRIIVYPNTGHLVLQTEPKSIHDIVEWIKEQSAKHPNVDVKKEDDGGIVKRTMKGTFLIIVRASIELAVLLSVALRDAWMKVRCWWNRYF